MREIDLHLGGLEEWKGPYMPSEKPWGHKLTVHVYVEGNIEKAVDISDVLAAMDLPEGAVDFAGVTITEVPEQPKGMDGS